MSATRQDPSLSGASFLASINAESSTSFGTNDAAKSEAGSVPSLPISAKVSLIDAQIDALEARIEQTITAHAPQLRQRAALTRTVDRDLNQLWQSINQTSSRLVTVGPQIAPIASDYHDALAQSSKQSLLISILSDMLAATRQLEALEKMQQQSDLPKLQTRLPEATKVMQPFSSSPALQKLPAVVELRARFDRLQQACATTKSEPLPSGAERPVPPSQAGLTSKDSTAIGASTDQALSPALKVLETARAIIVSRGSQEGWKEVRIELAAPALPPPAISAPAPPTTVAAKGDSQRSSMDTRPEHLIRDDFAPGSASLTRNSSSSSATNARNRHKPKLGARVIRPQDQLGSGPFNAEDAPLDEVGWGLDEDDGEGNVPPQVTANSHAVQPSQSTSHAGYPIHQSVAALVRDDHFGSPSRSVSMHSSTSSSSSQRSAFAIQEPVAQAEAVGSNEVDAWGLGEEETNNEVDAWDLNDDDAVSQQPLSPPKAAPHAREPLSSIDAHPPASAAAAQDAWGLEEDAEIGAEDDPWGTQQPPKEAAVEPAPALQSDSEPTDAPRSSSEPTAPHAEGDPWETADNGEQSATHQHTPEAHPAALASGTETQHDQVAVPPVLAHNGVDASAPLPSAVDPRTQAHPEPTRVASPDAVHTWKRLPSQDIESTRRVSAGSAEARSSARTAPVTDQHEPELVGQHVNAEQEADAWDFEESSSASEADRTEFAQMTSLPKPEASNAQVSAAPIASRKQAHLATACPVKSGPIHVAIREAREDEPAFSPPSSSGWPDDFSDPELTDVPATQSFKQGAVSSSTHRTASSTRSVSAHAKVPPSTGATPPKYNTEPTAPIATVLKEECTISKRSQDLVSLAETTMSSVLSSLQSGKASGAETDRDSLEALAATIFKIFELHRALMPVAHGEALREVPSLAMQFFNDCEYLARELTRLVSGKGGDIATAWSALDAEAAKRWKTKELITLEQEATLTRGLGQRWFEAQMTAQTKILLDTLMEADGFARTFDDQRYARCERCIKQVVQTLQQLSKAWRPVLVASRFHAAIGRLVDLVFQKVLHDVLDLEDIGESESEKIASLVKTLGSLEGLFAAEGSEQPSAAPLWVPSWFKMSYLIEILTGSLVDIEFLAFEAGALVDYSRKELAGLIKALFADTPNRSKLLRRIESAPVEVLAH
ncbi:hypothetical protein EX895_003113 [Sporisorium graminicola]|uniref:Retrograde transport protein Dsl1 C-terminal domain-containing protein n=1 Tax=Sporisorium graminicola TaxID=280036 RepID=A0A4U7KV53_9BASI|nr:hypothetical protein EX895_003113 [Sporisorium graminicola]TKY88017.1 hypothetical protein EX895_003113 [Sporisorium graminicola]